MPVCAGYNVNTTQHFEVSGWRKQKNTFSRAATEWQPDTTAPSLTSYLN